MPRIRPYVYSLNGPYLPLGDINILPNSAKCNKSNAKATFDRPIDAWKADQRAAKRAWSQPAGNFLNHGCATDDIEPMGVRPQGAEADLRSKNLGFRGGIG